MGFKSFLAFVSLAAIGTLILISGCTHFPQTKSNGYTLTWLGTAGWKLGYQGKTILIDPYLSRSSMKNKKGTAEGKKEAKEDWNQIWTSDEKSIEFALDSAQINQVHAILITHSHFDHFADVPYLVKKFPGATVYGNSTSCNILAFTNPLVKFVDISTRKEISVSGLNVQIIPSVHTLVGPERKVPFAGTISSPPNAPLKVNEYLEGGSCMFYIQGEGINLLYQGSASFIESELKEIHPKTSILATVFYQKMEHYQKKLIGTLRPKRVFLNHFDNFYLPYSSGIIPLNQMELNQFITELKVVDSSAEVTVPQFFKEISIQD